MAHRVPSLRSGVHIVALLVGVAVLLTETPVGQTQPKHGTISNLSTVVDGDLVRVSYDLESDDPGVVFTVRLEFSQDGGQTYQAAETVDGDVGLVLRGQRLTIIWSAGRDIETVSFRGFEYRVVIESEVVPAPVAETASLEVLSQPPGATVSVDGQPRGETPLSLALEPGEHSLVLARDGYLDNRQDIELAAGTAETLSITLTPDEANQVVAQDQGGGSRLPLILGVAAGGAAAAIVGVSAGGDDPQPGLTGTQTRRLTVVRTGSGDGFVTSSPPGINCGGDCTESYPVETIVTLSTDPFAENLFYRWEGDTDCSDGRVSMTVNTTCEAVFGPESQTIFERGTISSLTPSCIPTSAGGRLHCIVFSYQTTVGGAVEVVLDWADGRTDIELYLNQGSSSVAARTGIGNGRHEIRSSVAPGGFEIVVDWDLGPETVYQLTGRRPAI